MPEKPNWAVILTHGEAEQAAAYGPFGPEYAAELAVLATRRLGDFWKGAGVLTFAVPLGPYEALDSMLDSYEDSKQEMEEDSKSPTSVVSRAKLALTRVKVCAESALQILEALKPDEVAVLQNASAYNFPKVRDHLHEIENLIDSITKRVEDC